MNSWIMQLWLQKHDKSKWPDLRVSQTEDAFHVIDTPLHPTKEDIVAMCSEDFFAKHSYEYAGAALADPNYDIVYGTPPVSSSQSMGNVVCPRISLPPALVSVPSSGADLYDSEDFYEDMYGETYSKQEKEQPDAGNKVDGENSSLCEYGEVIRETRV